MFDNQSNFYNKTLQRIKPLNREEERAVFRKIDKLEVRFIAYLFRSKNHQLLELIDIAVQQYESKSTIVDQIIKIGNLIQRSKLALAFKHSIDLIASNQEIRGIHGLLYDAIIKIEDEFDISWMTGLKIAYKQIIDLRNKFAANNLKLVFLVTRSVINRCKFLELNDTIQEGNCGLIKAIEKFDYRKGFKFSTYAVWWIKHEVIRNVQDKERLVRIPIHRVESFSTLDRMPEKERIRIENDLTKTDAYSVYFIKNYKVFSLDAPIGEGDDTLHDVLASPINHSNEGDKEIIRHELSTAIIEMLTSLTPIESMIIRQRFYNDKHDSTLNDIAKKLNLSRERIRQIEERSLRKMRVRLKIMNY